MKLGVAGQLPKLIDATPAFFPADWRSIDADAIQRVRGYGFRGAQWFINKPLEAEAGDIRRVSDAFKAADLEVCQLNGWYEPICSYDDRLRAEGVKGAQTLARIGKQVDAVSVYVRPGGHNPRGHWFPHPENHSQRTIDNLVDSLKKICAVAESEGMKIAVEGHVLSPIDTPKRMREVIDAVGSPALGFNFDPVNMIGSVRDVHDTSRVIDECCELLGDRLLAAHAKDCALADQLVLHIDEVVPGTGAMSYALFMMKFQELCPDGYFIIEHLPDVQSLQARDFIVSLAKQIGVALEQ
jgi:sugar phosphate isomerase/epimerase